MRIRSVVTLCILLAATSCVREDFGIQASSILGDAARIETLLAEKGLDRSERDFDLRALHGRVRADDGSAVPGRCVTFVDDERAGDKQTAEFFYAKDGRFVGVRIRLRTDARDYDKGYYKIGRFLFDYWNALGGAGKPFTQAGGDVPILGKEALVARIEGRSDLDGRWVKQCFEGNLHDRVTDEVVIKLR